jgi:hypothetical protein
MPSLSLSSLRFERPLFLFDCKFTFTRVMEEDAPSLLTSALLTPLHFELPRFPVVCNLSLARATLEDVVCDLSLARATLGDVVCNLSLARVTLEDAPPLETVGDVFRPRAHATSEDGPSFGNHGRRILDW